MFDTEARRSRPELLRRLEALMLLRVVFVSLFLGASVFLQVRETRSYFGNIQNYHYFLISAIYFLTLIYAFLLKYLRRLQGLAYCQLLMDCLFVTAVIYTTGGIESTFSFLYILNTISASILLYRKGGMIIASCGSILYGLLVDLHYYHVIQPLGIRESAFSEYHAFQVFYLILVNIAGFYLVAYLSSYVSEQARARAVELAARETDIYKLEVLNETIIKGMNSGLIVIDGNNKIILFNPACEEIFEAIGSDSYGRKVDDILPFLADYLTDKRLSFIRSANRGYPPIFDLVYDRPHGEKTYLRLTISSIKLPFGEEKGFILIIQDVTYVKEVEEEIKKVEGLAMIGELAAGIAHEIRNPMTSISGSIQMLKDRLERDDVNSRLMDIVSREISRLNHLVNDFLLFARPKQANPEEFNLNRLIQESLELFQNSHHWGSGLEVRKDFQDEIVLRSDPELIKQVLWNLLLNAHETMQVGGTIFVSTSLESQEFYPYRKRAGIIVRDTGKGFTERALSQIFTPFFTTKEGGSGLGLPTVKRIVGILGGEVTGSNHPEGGAQIKIWIPIAN